MSTSLQDVIDDGSVAMVTTMVGRQLSSRPVQCAEIGPARVTFLVHRDAEWVKHVEGREAIVHVTVADSDGGCWVSLNGTVSPTHDPAQIRTLWRPEVHGAFFAADDPDAVILHFDVTDGEFWGEAGRTGTALTLPVAPTPQDRSRATE